MLEVRRANAIRTYENSFFREFAEGLSKIFLEKKLDGLLIGNGVCEKDETLQIDALLICNSSICIIDFKNFGGKIKLPNEYMFEHGEWKNEEGEKIKGGSSRNPFYQLKKQKQKLSTIINDFIKDNLEKDDFIDPSHIKTIVCFQKNIELDGKIPQINELTFFITDNYNYKNTIDDIISINDEKVKINTKETFNLFKKYFKADDFKINLLDNYKFDSKEEKENLIYDILSDSQKDALNEINLFLNKDEEKVFILNGSSKSGKSYLIDFIEELAFKNNFKEVKKLVFSKRLTKNLSGEFSSIYSLIYGGNKEKEDDGIKIIPIKENKDEDETLYIVDKAELVSDLFNEGFEIRFGSGKILKDFLEFVNLEKNKRKIIFIGDNFLLNFGKNAILKDYLEKEYNFDKIGYFCLDDNVENIFLGEKTIGILNSLRGKKFNYLYLSEENEYLKNINELEIKDIIKKNILENKNFKILTYKNSSVNKINLWIKKNILKNGENLSVGDLVLINNNLNIQNEDIFSENLKIFNGDFARILEIGDFFQEKVPIKNKEIILNFRKVFLGFENGKKEWLYVFENYLKRDENEILKEEIIAFNIILNNEIKKYKENFSISFEDLQIEENIFKENYDFIESVWNDGKTLAGDDEFKKDLKNRVKLLKENIRKKILNDKNSKSFKIFNSLHLKYGWCLTIHKSIYYEFDNIIFDASYDQGKTNETYFKMIYTALTRTKDFIFIKNFENISPFSKIEFSEKLQNQKINENYFFANEKIEFSENDLEIIKKYNFPEENKNILLQFLKFISIKIEDLEIKIKHNNYQEIYEISENEKKLSFSVYFNKKGEFKNPSNIKSNSKDFEKKILNSLEKNDKLKNFDFIIDDWRKEIYIKIYDFLKLNDIFIVYILQNKFKDQIKLKKMGKNIIFDLYYDSKNFFTKCNLIFSEDNEIWEYFKTFKI